LLNSGTYCVRFERGALLCDEDGNFMLVSQAHGDNIIGINMMSSNDDYQPAPEKYSNQPRIRARP
jgi:hypothetical protein